ncbi:MAG: hypothetical protein MUP58_01110 [Candidatus Nanohaloarchaeota archaeon QJJ-9]|nr:hypothetical protein [Candidatus Nanohaloarchaeota archaeon QJJ-9]
MRLLEPLKEELAENFEAAKSAENLITKERDMLQGNSQERVLLYTLSTDVWDSVTSSGELKNLEESAGEVAKAYRHIEELNTAIEKFNQFGNKIMYSPLLKKTTEQYNRKELLDIIAEICSEASVKIMNAKEELEEVIRTECPACGRRFPNRKAMKSHVTQKQDPEHQEIKNKII